MSGVKAQCSGCGHTWTTRKSPGEIDRPRCSECDSEEIEFKTEETTEEETDVETLREELEATKSMLCWTVRMIAFHHNDDTLFMTCGHCGAHVEELSVSDFANKEYQRTGYVCPECERMLVPDRGSFEDLQFKP